MEEGVNVSVVSRAVETTFSALDATPRSFITLDVVSNCDEGELVLRINSHELGCFEGLPSHTSVPLNS